MITQVRQRRVVVGVDGSPLSLAAVRQAVAQARCRGAELRVVYARPPVEVTGFPALVDRDLSAVGSMSLAAAQQRARYEAATRDEEGRALIAAALEQAVGGTPLDITVHWIVAVGKPGPALVAQAWSGDDLLVLGTRGGRRWRHLRRGSISRYCTRHADCPVLVVPNDDDHYTAALDELHHDLTHLDRQAGPAAPTHEQVKPAGV